MLYIPEDQKESFIAKHGLEIKEYKCSKCGDTFLTDIPFVMKGYAGVESKIHSCGYNYREMVVTPTSKENIAFWSTIV